MIWNTAAGLLLTSAALVAADAAQTLGVRNLAKANRLLLNFAGAATAVGTIDDVNGRLGTTASFDGVFGTLPPGVTVADSDFIGCLEMDMLDLEKQEKVGKGTDCLWGLSSGGGVAAVSFFEFDCGTIVAAGLTSTGDFTEGVGNGAVLGGSSPNVDTLSGSLPEQGSNAMVEGTGDFVGVTGNVRLSGALHLATSPYFNCVWELNIVTAETPSCGIDNDDMSSALLTEDTAIALARSGNAGDYHEGSAVVQFLGVATNIGDVSDANEAVGLDSDAVSTDAALPGVDVSSPLGCHSVDMVDMQSKEVIGLGVDCLWGIEGGVAAISYHKFDDMGVIVNSGLTSVALYTENVGANPVLIDGSSPNAAAMTGSFPQDSEADDTFFLTTGEYEGYKGNTRLSGAVTPGDPFYFNCIWVFNLKIPQDDGGSGAVTAFLSSVSMLVSAVGSLIWIMV